MRTRHLSHAFIAVLRHLFAALLFGWFQITAIEAGDRGRAHDKRNP